MNVIIAGSRTITNPYALEYTIEHAKRVGVKISNIISGGANGIDSLAEKYAREHHIALEIFIPDWRTHGRVAGLSRNVDMALHAVRDGQDGALIVVWDGKSKGTQHMMKTAKGLLMMIVGAIYTPAANSSNNDDFEFFACDFDGEMIEGKWPL